jgi:hypothetical protein
LIEDHVSQASTRRTVPLVREANGHPSADTQWPLYLALRDRISRLYGNPEPNTEAKVNVVASEADNFSGVLALRWVRK